MVNSRVRQVFFGRIVLQLLQIDIPSRLELAAAGATGGWVGEKKYGGLNSAFSFHYRVDCQRRPTFAPSVELAAGVAVITEYRGHALGTADVPDGRGVPPYVIQRVLHR